MKPFLLGGCVVWLATAAARADAPFVELDGRNGFWGSPGVPDDAVQNLKAVQQGNQDELKCIAFTPQGDWVFLFGGNGFYTSNVNLPACRKLRELQRQGRELKCVAFAPAGGWTVLWDQNGNWTEGAIPDGAFQKIVDVTTNGGTLRSVAFGPNGSWVVLFDQTGIWYGGIGAELGKVLENAIRKQLTVLCVAFAGRDWVCLTTGGWWTSNPQLAASRLIADNVRKGYLPKWVAVMPASGPTDFARWSQVIHGALDGKLAGGYAFEVLDHGKVVARGAEGWARAPWEPVAPSVKWTLDKPMSVASVSKTVTAVALLKLWEESNTRFSLDEPFWPHLKRVCPAAAADVQRVTIRELLTHRSGFQKVDDCTTPRDLQRLLKLPLAHRPGTVHEYQNNNYYILHLLIESIGRVPYTRYVKEHVLRPMGITHMETHSEAVRPTCAYSRPGDRQPGEPYQQDCASWAGAAGWYASASDLGRFLDGLRRHRVLSPETTAVMLEGSMGWDYSEPCWAKGGTWSSGEREVGSAIAHFPDGTDAVILVNCRAPTNIEDLLVRAWKEGRGG
jgi:CubicO group peptidase (beta-lactamase class C family)